MRRSFFVGILLCHLCAATPLLRALQGEEEPCAKQTTGILPAALRANGADQAKLADTLVQASIHYFDNGVTDRVITITTKGTNSTKIADLDHWTVLTPGKTQRADTSGSLRPLSDTNARARKIEHLPVLFLKDLIDSDYQCTSVSATDLEGKHLRVSKKRQLTAVADSTQNAETEVFFDQSSFLVSKLRFKMVSLNDWRRTIPVEILYDDYREIAGVKVPFRQRKYLAGQLYSELTLTAISLDTGISDSAFLGAR
jgi:hypothetical protein